MRTTKTEEDERGGRKPTPVLYHGGKFDLTISTHITCSGCPLTLCKAEYGNESLALLCRLNV
ncbi:hypothetical protein VCRA2123E131_10411 [Vibrio crassostreae]|nr:hypothetical protein VCRA2126E132_10411 [Vibrio crassostreae]CAK3783887.1 hypothetical protein VCRA2123E131_10411 [Vibrio crassostreae]